jgi:hypothetical protein
MFAVYFCDFVAANIIIALLLLLLSSIREFRRENECDKCLRFAMSCDARVIVERESVSRFERNRLQRQRRRRVRRTLVY